MNHTPGPWEVNTLAGRPNSEVFAGNQLITDCRIGGLDLEETEANARLIAAAPTGHDLISRAFAGRIDDQWLKEARAYMEAVNGNS